ncbi:MAG: glycyl-radical enzyme activating protein [Lachnospiraceae bacterium]|nr:glycyl-radical enzyme activating protein [Lachnospiraceae bacterium]
MQEITGIISDIKRMSVHDGPGIRTTLFLKGCPLRCRWCHNPENLTTSKTLSYTAKLCVGCGACAAVCPARVHEFVPVEASQEGAAGTGTVNTGAERAGASVHILHYDRCLRCGACVRECFTDALKMYGAEADADTVAKKLLEDTAFFRSSGGGVTFSGGEPLLQPDFLATVMKELKKEDVHVAVDSCAFVPWEAFEKVLPYTDLFLIDVKHIDSGEHRRMTGQGNELILENLKKLADVGAAVEIRTPVIPGYNDDTETLRKIGTLLASMGNIAVWRLLPYHSMGKAKYEAIGLTYEMPEIKQPTPARMRELTERLKDVFPGVRLSSDL